MLGIEQRGVRWSGKKEKEENDGALLYIHERRVPPTPLQSPAPIIMIGFGKSRRSKKGERAVLREPSALPIQGA